MTSQRQAVFLILKDSAEGATFRNNAYVDFRLSDNFEIKGVDGQTIDGLLYRVRLMRKGSNAATSIKKNYSQVQAHYGGIYGCQKKLDGKECRSCDAGHPTFPMLRGSDWWVNNHVRKLEVAIAVKHDTFGRSIADYVKGAFTV